MKPYSMVLGSRLRNTGGDAERNDSERRGARSVEFGNKIDLMGADTL